MKSAEREHYGLAVCCAKRFAGRGVPMEELISEAEAALLWAASRFDEQRGVRFSTYAVPVVLGALRQLCRSRQPMHVPRGDQRILSQAAAARQRLYALHQREPDLAAIASDIGVDVRRLGVMLAADERMRASSGALDASSAAEDGFEDAVLLRDAIRRLPAPCAQIVWLRMFRGATQTAIARQLGLSQPQISRCEKTARLLLKKILYPEA